MNNLVEQVDRRATQPHFQLPSIEELQLLGAELCKGNTAEGRRDSTWSGISLSDQVALHVALHKAAARGHVINGQREQALSLGQGRRHRLSTKRCCLLSVSDHLCKHLIQTLQITRIAPP